MRTEPLFLIDEQQLPIAIPKSVERRFGEIVKVVFRIMDIEPATTSFRPLSLVEIKLNFLNGAGKLKAVFFCIRGIDGRD